MHRAARGSCCEGDTAYDQAQAEVSAEPAESSTWQRVSLCLSGWLWYTLCLHWLGQRLV